MRKAVLNMGWTRNGADEVVGISFGFDFCTEHEESIVGLKTSFGVGRPAKSFTGKIIDSVRGEKPLAGVDAKRINYKGGLAYGMTGDVSQLSFTVHRTARWIDLLVNEARDALNRGTTDPVTYWGRDEFLVVSKDHDAVVALERMITSNDAIMFINQIGLGAGLVIHSISGLPEGVAESMRLADESKLRLDMAVKKSGIFDIVNEAVGCGYFSLRPAWKDDSESDIIFWLNPTNQGRNNSGWYSFNELKQWTEGKGPVIKQVTTKD